jgi:hypothetical protein
MTVEKRGIRWADPKSRKSRQSMFQTRSDAKRFFIHKILEQAQLEGVALSAAEVQMLSWSESDPEFKPDDANRLVDQLASEMSDTQYESKIAALLTRAYDRDVESDSSIKTPYREAHSVLKQGTTISAS